MSREEDRRRHVTDSDSTAAAFSFSSAPHFSLPGARARGPCGGLGSRSFIVPGLSIGTLDDGAGALLARWRGHSLRKRPRAGPPTRYSAAWRSVEQEIRGMMSRGWVNVHIDVYNKKTVKFEHRTMLESLGKDNNIHNLLDEKNILND